MAGQGVILILFSISYARQVYETPSPGLCILQAQVQSPNGRDAEIELPPFLDVERRLQGSDDEKMYGAYGLSVIGK
jgi:hypothetical protein